MLKKLCTSLIVAVLLISVLSFSACMDNGEEDPETDPKTDPITDVVTDDPDAITLPRDEF